MKRVLLVGIVALTATLTGATGATADNDKAKNLAAKACHAEKKADKEAFRATYGPKHAMRNCIKQTTPEAEEALKNAAKECKAERKADPDAFKATYGANENGKNAFGKCVSSKAKEDLSEG